MPCLFPQGNLYDAYNSRYLHLFMLGMGWEFKANPFNKVHLLPSLWTELTRHWNSEEIMTLVYDKGPKHIKLVLFAPPMTGCEGCSVGWGLQCWMRETRTMLACGRGAGNLGQCVQEGWSVSPSGSHVIVKCSSITVSPVTACPRGLCLYTV